jgi:phosphoenolpyruvate synthase/pyruvate phosphate dikinase
MARPFLRRIGEALGCSLQQVLFSSLDEVRAALAGEAQLPLAEIDARIAQPGDVEGLVLLSGLTGCRGRAAGPVRVVLDAPDLDRLQYGDVLVTAASTTDFAGGATVFPTRGGGPDALERALAVVTDEGGALSHAAIVCRERGIPCVLGVELATSDLAEGRVVDVDATRQLGQVFTLD